MNNSKSFDKKSEKRIAAPPETLMLTLTVEACYLIINALDLYSRIWIGQYERMDDLSIYDTGGRWNRNTKSHMLFQQIRDLLIPSLCGHGDYTCCSLGIWSDETNIKAINAYDIQQRLRYEISWFRKPEGSITVDFDEPWIRGSLGDCSVFCEKIEDSIRVSLYLSTGQLDTIQTSLEVYKLLTDRNIYEAFRYYTNDDKALELAKELTAVYEKYDYISFPSDKDFGERIYRDLKNVTAFVISKIRKTAEERTYTDYIRVNISPMNPFIATEEMLKILDRPFEHFRKARRKFPPDNVLKLPGAGFLTKMIGKEHSTKDYFLVWYDEKSRTEYYYMGEDYTLKHEGRSDLPEDIRQYIRIKCKATGGMKLGK